MHVDLVSLLVDDYDEGIDFFVRVLGFDLVEDTVTDDRSGGPKRWVVVRPRDGSTGLLLSRASDPHQASVVGEQFAGRVGFVLRVDDFTTTYGRLVALGVRFAESPRDEAYGTVVVFYDVAGNKWDLIGPPR